MNVREPRRGERRKGEEGLTLIELLIVVTIIGILAAIVSVSVGGVTTTTNEKARQSKLQGVQSAVDAYRLGESKQGGTIAAFPVEDTTVRKCTTAGVTATDEIDGTAAATAWYSLDGKIVTLSGNLITVTVDGDSPNICDTAATAVAQKLVNIISTGGLAQKGYFRANASTTLALGSGNKGFWCVYHVDTPFGNTGPQATTGIATSASPTAKMGKVIACTDNLTIRP